MLQHTINPVSKKKRDQARKNCPVEYRSGAAVFFLSVMESKRNICFGFHLRKKKDNTSRLSKEERMSGSSGPRKLDEKYWTMAKVPPVTKMAGITSRVFFHPDMTNTSQNGTKIDKSGNWRPT